MKHVVLSPRQFEIAKLLASGMTQGEVAAHLGIAERTVWHHTAEIRRKAGASTTASALSRVRARGLAPRSGPPVEII